MPHDLRGEGVRLRIGVVVIVRVKVAWTPHRTSEDIISRVDPCIAGEHDVPAAGGRAVPHDLRFALGRRAERSSSGNDGHLARGGWGCACRVQAASASQASMVGKASWLIDGRRNRAAHASVLLIR